MRIMEFSRAIGVSPDTVRKLERKGVLASRRDWAGHRRYTDEDVDRARATLFGEAQERRTGRSRDPRAIRPRQG
jgi:DNA-binding transcriptional MerR regulator